MKKVSIILIIFILIAVAIVIVFINQKKTYPESSNTENIICDVTDQKLCKTDQDCICIEHAGCFMGNKNYYEKCVDKTGGCFDFCVGWGQKPVKCINNKCSISY